jgi:hypothetical protein
MAVRTLQLNNTPIPTSNYKIEFICDNGITIATINSITPVNNTMLISVPNSNYTITSLKITDNNNTSHIQVINNIVVTECPIISGNSLIFIKNSTGGLMQYPSEVNGFSTYQNAEQYIMYWKQMGVEAIHLVYEWSKFETANGVYNTTFVSKNIDWLITNGLKYNIVFWALNSNETALHFPNIGIDVLKHSNGIINNRFVDFSSSNNKNRLQSAITAMANVVNSTQLRRDNLLNFSLGMGVTEEYYNNYDTSSGVSPGNYTNNTLANWRQFLVSKYGVTTPYTYNGNNISGNMQMYVVDTSNPPASLLNTNGQVGKDWLYFIAKELYNFIKVFRDAVKAVNNNFKVFYYPSAVYDLQTMTHEMGGFALHKWAMDLCDGVYATCNDGPNNNENLKFIDFVVGTYGSTKEIALEFDPDDARVQGTPYTGNNAQFGNAPMNFQMVQNKIEEYIKRCDKLQVHFAMYFDDSAVPRSGNFPNAPLNNQITGFQSVINYLKTNYNNGQGKYNRTTAPNITIDVDSLINNGNYHVFNSSWTSANGQITGNPVNIILTQVPV